VIEAGPVRAMSADQAAAARTVTRSGFAYGIGPGGMDEVQSGIGAATASDRKSLLTELWEAYLRCPWAWVAVQTIARTVTAGGLVTDWDADSGEGDQEAPDKPANVLALEALLDYVNPAQNIRQLCRNFIADLLVFGDAYLEVVWIGSLPVALYNQDSPTTTPIADSHGAVSRYVQVSDYGQRADFEPHEIIHVSLDAARPSVLGISPMQAAVESVKVWLFANGTGKEAAKKGLPPNFHADFPAGAADKDMRTWRDQHATRNLGARNIGAPIITKGGVKLNELQTGKIGDVIALKNQARDEILSDFGVPPAEGGVIEAGNLGGGTGDSQHRTYQINTCGPIGELVIEALNFALTIQAFRITDWKLKFGEVDYRDSVIVEGIRSQRLRDGAWTLNKYRAEIGEPPVPGGDDAVLVDRQNLVLWADMAAMSKAVVAGKGAPGVAAGEQPPGGEPVAGDPSAPDAPPGDGDPDQPAGKSGMPKSPRESLPPAPREALRATQLALYQARLREAMGRMPIAGSASSTIGGNR